MTNYHTATGTTVKSQPITTTSEGTYKLGVHAPANGNASCYYERLGYHYGTKAASNGKFDCGDANLLANRSYNFTSQAFITSGTAEAKGWTIDEQLAWCTDGQP